MIIKDSIASVKPYILLNQKMNKIGPISPTLLNISITYKESLTKYPDYNLLKERLNSYNKKISKGLVIDEYQIRTYQKLFQLMFDLTNVYDMELQQSQIKNIKQWLLENQRIIKSRVSQGMERVVVTKDSRKAIEEIDKLYNLKQQLPKTNQSKIPSDQILDSALPYFRKWRTMHEDMPLPSSRLHYYQRRIIQQTPIYKQSSPSKYSILDQSIPEYKDYSTAYNSIIQRADQDGKDVQIQFSQISVNNEENNEGGQQIVLDDIPMFGQEPGEDGDLSRQQNTDNDLVPKVKLYLSQTQRKPQQTQKGSHMFMKLKETIQQKRRELKYQQSRTIQLIKKNQDRQFIKLGQKRAKNKSSVIKQQNMTMELRISSPKYKKLEQNKRQQFKLSNQFQKKYHFNQSKSLKKDDKIVDLSICLPKLNLNRREFTQKNSQMHSLNLLKKKYSSILQLSPEQKDQNPQQPIPNSISQFSHRKKVYSTISDDTKAKLHRLQNLNQLQNVRQKLQANKIGISVQTLVNSLLPPEQNEVQQLQITDKNLLHNEFMVETKKKKKKA